MMEIGGLTFDAILGNALDAVGGSLLDGLGAFAVDFCARFLTFSSSCLVALFSCLFFFSKFRKVLSLPSERPLGLSMLEALTRGLALRTPDPDPGRPPDGSGPVFFSNSVSSILRLNL